MKAAAREESAMDSTQRFSTRVEAYVKYRPGYPAAMLDFLARELAMGPEAQVADIGAGTGILTSPAGPPGRAGLGGGAQ